MNILEAVNYAYPDTIKRLSLESFPNSVLFGNVFVEVGAGKTLPAWSAVPSLIETYEAQAARQIKLSALASHRYAVEVGGITINGMTIATDDRSKMMLGNARIAATANEEFTADWKTPSGFVTLTAGQIIAISDAVAEHVNKCFASEFTVTNSIDNYATSQDCINAFDALMS